ncbi:branched-chain amino acid ABC transporter permease [Herbaspirillum sp. RTI4]|uniref:branched-chain amino acid ABC transporter permease n=1 Tax=Herbaspirillum sp. RTI4 TaxID=3048640 RepID=UPI002AB34F85|nr:branched-chain amino acid ABC transporter permease [Herbaspirillum sp. RTI4]MDY7578409.1 branched-chain amino acid ABC transporter permease [Herbaspirillum sp. RTI4]MEA9982577.1 branched-chain amino acid ABC transporter permease [Herbaspirillum sp. RTI4]
MSTSVSLYRSARLPLAALLIAAAMPWFLSEYTQSLLVNILIYAIFALSLELLVGTTGLVSLGHAAFSGVAAYVTALLMEVTGPGDMLLVLPAAMLGAGAYALFVGALSLRTRGVYFIMVTLAFAQMAFFIFHDTAIGGGSDGMYLSSRPSLALAGKVLIDLESPQQFYFFTLACLAVTYALLAVLLRSRFGRALAGIRLNEQRMRAVGFPTYGYKLAAFVIAGMLAGLAGFLMAARTGVVNPELLSWHESGAVLLMLILGGLGSLRGAVIGAAAFILLKEFYSSEAVFGPFALHWQMSLGVTMILCVALLPHGLIGLRFPLKLRSGLRAKQGVTHG